MSHARVYLHKLCDSHVHQGDDDIPNLENIRVIVTEVVAESLAESLTPIKDQINVLSGKVDRLLRMTAQVLPTPQAAFITSDKSS